MLINRTSPGRGALDANTPRPMPGCTINHGAIRNTNPKIKAEKIVGSLAIIIWTKLR